MIKSFILKFWSLFCVFGVICCNDLTVVEYCNTLSVFDRNVTYGYISSNLVLERTYQMASIEWTPLKAVPAKNEYFEAGQTVIGLPYSSVKEINTYLFQDVSYHTFITAVNNSQSVLYTEDISMPPYHGENCATYYGAVCSSTIMWAFGIDIPYYANQIKSLSCFRKLQSQEIDSLKVCDIMWRPNHVQMIYSLEYKDDILYRVTTFESSGRVAHLTTYSAKDFKELWNNNSYVGYRYKYINYSDTPFNPKGLDSVNINLDLCPSKGDKSLYRLDETVVVNIINDCYSEIILVKDGREFARHAIVEDIHKYDNLPQGIYTVFLANQNLYSSSVSFEVKEVAVSCNVDDIENSIEVSFVPSANPQYAILCTVTGNSVYFPISEEDRKRGYIRIPLMQEKEYYCKVIFKGQYGTISNSPLRIL